MEQSVSIGLLIDTSGSMKKAVTGLRLDRIWESIKERVQNFSSDEFEGTKKVFGILFGVLPNNWNEAGKYLSIPVAENMLPIRSLFRPPEIKLIPAQEATTPTIFCFDANEILHSWEDKTKDALKLNMGGISIMAEALETAEKVFLQNKTQKKFLLIISDGEPTSASPLPVAEKLKNQGVVIACCAIKRSLDEGTLAKGVKLMSRIASSAKEYQQYLMDRDCNKEELLYVIESEAQLRDAIADIFQFAGDDNEGNRHPIPFNAKVSGSDRIDHLSLQTQNQITFKLKRNIPGYDWKEFASKMQQILREPWLADFYDQIMHSESPPITLFQCWSTKSSYIVQNLIVILKEMQHDELLELVCSEIG